jgi:hypothetical protein
MRPTSQSPNGPTTSSRELVLTAGEILRDGTVLELARLPDRSTLHVWRSGQSRLAARYEAAGKIYEPLRLDATVLAAIRLPAGSAGYGSVGQLFDAILGALAKFSGLPKRDLTAANYWIFASWFPELLPVVPSLIVSGSSPAEARKFLRLLRCFCRRGVLLTEVSSSGFLALPMYLRPTLLLEQAKLDRRTRGLLCAAAGGTYVPNRGALLDLRCARAICSEDAELDDSALTVSLFPAAVGVPSFDTSAEDKLAAEFQPQLLRFRCKNFRMVASSTFDVPAFTVGVRDLARSLGASIVGDATLTAGIISLLSVRDSDVRATLVTRPDFAIVVALLTLVHERKESRIPVAMLTGFVNAALRAGGEIKEYSPPEIGRLLSRLSVPRARNAGGVAIDLTREVSRRVHELKRRYGVTTTPASFSNCPDCAGSGMLDDGGLL